MMNATIPFKFFVEARNASMSTRASLQAQPAVIMGGFIPGVDTSLTEAEDFEHTNVTRIPILFDNDDIKFLLQFPQVKWLEALLWRYGEGLKMASEHSNAPEEMNFNMKPSGRKGGALMFPNAKLYLRGLFKKLTDSDGPYKYDLSDWRHMPIEKSDGSSETQLRTVNYVPLIYKTADNTLRKWKQYMGSGFLGKDPSAPFGQFEKVGKPSDKISLDWDGRILNSKAGEMVPMYTANHLKDLVDPSMLRGSEADKQAEIIYKFQQDGSNVEKKSSGVPLLLPGRMYQNNAVKQYDAHVDLIQHLFNENVADTPMGQRPILHVDDLKGHVTPDAFERISEATKNAKDFLPGEKNAAHQISLVDYTRLAANARAPKTRVHGGYEGNYHSREESHVDNQFLQQLGLSRQEYEKIITDHFLGSKDLNVIGPKGASVKTPIWDALLSGISTASKQEGVGHTENLREELPTMLVDMRKFVQRWNGLADIKNFVAAVVNKTPQADLEELWDKVAAIIRKRSRTYCASSVSQLDLGYGTRAMRKNIKTRSIDALTAMGSSQHDIGGMGMATRDADVDLDGNDSGDQGDSKDVIPTNKVGKKLGRTQSGVANEEKPTDDGLAFYWGSGVKNMWKLSKEMDALKQERSSPDLDESKSAAMVGQEARLRGDVVRTVMLDILSKDEAKNGPMDFDAAKKSAIEKTRSLFKSKGLGGGEIGADIIPISSVSDSEKQQIIKELKKPKTKQELAGAQLSLFAHLDDNGEKEAPAAVAAAPAGAEKPPIAMPAQASSEPSSPAIDIDSIMKMTPNAREDHFSSPLFAKFLAHSPRAMAQAKAASQTANSRVLLAQIAKAENMMKKPIAMTPPKLNPTPQHSDDNADDDDISQFRSYRR